jgi:hypothetical protein
MGDDNMLKDYPATQLFLISLVFLVFLVFITPIASGWHVYFAAVLDSLKFIVKVICVFFLIGTVVDVLKAGAHFRKHYH